MNVRPGTYGALLLELVQEVRLLRAEFHQFRDGRTPQRASDDAALLRALRGVFADQEFTASAAVELTGIPGPDDALRVALKRRNARQLGRLLRRLEGRAIDGLQVARVGTSRIGVLWRVRVSRV